MSAPARGARFARRVVRSPLLHFAVVGALLLGVRARLQDDERAPAPQAERAPIVISAAQAAGLEREFAKRWGRPPTPAERAAALEEAAQDEMLYREARLLALGFRDASVRRRLVEMMRTVGDQPGRDEDALVREAITLGLDDDIVIRRLLGEKMRLVLQQDQGGVPIRDEELARLRERDRDKLVQPATVSLTQVFLSTDARTGEQASRDAAGLLDRLRSGALSADHAAALADPLPLGGTLRGYTQLQVQGRFGKDFADAVFALPAGRWSGPIASPFGLHLVRVDERRAERLPALDELRPALTAALRRERARANLARGLQRLRELYEVRIEGTQQTRAGDEGAPDARS